MTKFQIKPIISAEERETFLNLPALVYQKDPNWVPPLRSSIKKQLAPDNPFTQYGESQPFIAVSSTGEPLGRIVAAVNKRLIEKENQQVGLFGYFECVQDFEVAQALLNTACDWLIERGMKVARGPIDLSTHNNCLFLVDGFHTPPAFMMPYNPPYYPQFIEQAGWEKAKDAVAYDFPVHNHQLTAKFKKGYNIALKSGITFRSIRLKGKGFEEDCGIIYHLFTTAFVNNWSSTPRSEAEFVAEAKDLQQLIDPDILIIAEDKNKAIGFFMALPDYNIPLKQVNGKLDLWGTLKFLWYRRQINHSRVLAICSLPEYRRQMVPIALIYLGMTGGTQKGKPYQTAELSWVWEDNLPSRKLIEASGGKISKTYRIYEKELS
ncbi:MAG: hypothetical protein GDA44_13895 [Prochloron sp. SP5CPC1]|nr:hypothetical protein [Candidatus Paraprochloron terpiosi SP5CPC1]